MKFSMRKLKGHGFYSRDKYLSQLIFAFRDFFYTSHSQLTVYLIPVFTTEGFFEVTIESWPEWYLNPRPLNSVQTL